MVREPRAIEGCAVGEKSRFHSQLTAPLHDAEHLFLFQALMDQFPISRFEDVQRQRRARKQHNVERKQG